MDLLLSFILLLLLCSSLLHADDTAALTAFRSHTDFHGALLSNWTTNSSACTANWVGIQCIDNRVTVISLPFLNLSGSIAALSSLDQLRILDLRGNRLNGALTPLTHCLNLMLIYLSDNHFSGEIPPHLSTLNRLFHLDLSSNNLQGPIPTQFSSLSHLLTLYLENNKLSGEIPIFLASLPQLKRLNLSNNEFYGMLPEELLSRHGVSSFSGNEGLCRKIHFRDCVRGLTPQSLPSNPHAPSPSTISIHESSENHHERVIALVSVTVVLVIIMALLAAVCYCCKTLRKTRLMVECERISRYGNIGGGDSEGTTTIDKNELALFDRKKQFELHNLLRASAEVLGKGSLGTVYKLVLNDGSMVAVKRLEEANPCARKMFEQYIDVIRKLRHPNVVPFRAFYYAREEKLLVYDYMPNGSLHSLLHGNRGPGANWRTRMRLIMGAARGLSIIHEEYADSRIPHGNVKSSNVLVDKNGNACISGFGLSLLVHPVHAVSRLGGYRAPEQAEIKRLSQMADVYSFGVLLLEVLTGRAPGEEDDGDLPKWVRSVATARVFDQELLRYNDVKEEMVSMLQVAMECVVAQPENRPTMNEVARMIEEITVVEQSQSPNNDN